MITACKAGWWSMAVGALLCMTLAVPAQASDPIARGRSLALVVCTYCHIVEDNQEAKPILTIRLPTFQEIADAPDTTAQSLRIFLRTQHTDKPTAVQMPNPALNDDQIEDVVAYILSRRVIHRINAAVPPPHK